MGLSIHYNGTIKDMKLLPKLVEEVRDVCQVLGWKYHLEDEEILTGISFTPPECETVSLTFLPTGELVNKVYMLFNIQPVDTISVKTQFAGMEVHITVLKLLKHLANQYFANFHLIDEGGYWETEDEETLRKQFGLYNVLLDTVTNALNDFKAEEGDTPEGLADRLEKFLNERWRKGKL